MVKTLNKLVYKAHIKYMDYCEKVEVHHRLVTTSTNEHML